MDSLIEYINNTIIPRYAVFDAAHQESHIHKVIEQALALAKHYDVDSDILLVAAAFHDLGLIEGREQHHLASGRIIRSDSNLRKWLSPQQIEIAAQAAEDHRASAKEMPRSIYGRIIAEADRQIDPETVIRRTVQYGFCHYPEMNRKQMRERAFAHLEEKYGEDGYLKLWIPESPNADKLAELRRIIADKTKLRKVFDAVYREEKYGPLVCERFRNEPAYRRGHINIVAAKEGTVILGLHTPQMKALAKENALRSDWREILQDLADTPETSPLSHDERIIWGLTIDRVKCGISERFELIDRFLPHIDNWAICDTFCCNAKWASKPCDRDAVWDYAIGLTRTDGEFTRRVGIIFLMCNFLTESDIDRTFEAVSAMGLHQGEPYYVRMGVAWMLATALAKFPEKTVRFVDSSDLPSDIKSLYIRKAKESRRTRGMFR